MIQTSLKKALKDKAKELKNAKRRATRIKKRAAMLDNDALIDIMVLRARAASGASSSATHDAADAESVARASEPTEHCDA